VRSPWRCCATRALAHLFVAATTTTTTTCLYAVRCYRPQAAIVEGKPDGAPALCVIDTDCTVDFEGSGSAVVSSASTAEVVALREDLPASVSVGADAPALFMFSVPQPLKASENWRVKLEFKVCCMLSVLAFVCAVVLLTVAR
jgi:hypothetical protein